MFPLKISTYISKWLDYHNIFPRKVEIKSTALHERENPPQTLVALTKRVRRIIPAASGKKQMIL